VVAQRSGTAHARPVTTTAPATAAARLSGQPTSGHGFLAALDDRRRALAAFGPNWFASVMGTSIVATAAVTLPVSAPWLRPFALGVWVLAGLLLVAVTAATAVHWLRHPERARAHLRNPVMAQFYGAPPMALLAFGTATLLVGIDVLGNRIGLAADVVLWLVGTAFGLLAAVVVPYRLFTRLEVAPDGAFGGWLMPVVPPMVSAATGALLVPHTPAGQLRQTLLLGCYAMFGMSLLATVVVVTLLWSRLAQHKVGPAAMVPTLWIVLGPLGQSITAANNLGNQAALALPSQDASAFRVVGLVYGVPVWGFGLMWAVLAGAITVRTARSGLPFTLSWWSFVFPVGTMVTGTSDLAVASGSDLFRGAAVLLFVGLVGAWVVVAVRTAAGTWSGRLLRA
jgi:C4-dicarboxylate transporter/malic acid transport protein